MVEPFIIVAYVSVKANSSMVITMDVRDGMKLKDIQLEYFSKVLMYRPKITTRKRIKRKDIIKMASITDTETL